MSRSLSSPGSGSGTPLQLQDPEPWPEPVDGRSLLDELESTVKRYLVLPDGGATALTLFIVHCHAHEAAHVSPILALVSPEKQCGKTVTLELLLALVPRSLLASNITTAAVFRAIELYRPTLLVDEADTFLAEHEELRGVLNSGHSRASAVVVRNVPVAGGDYEPRAFSTWAPKVIAKIGELPETLADRSIRLPMRRWTAAEEATLEEFRRDRVAEHELLRRKAWRWAQDNLDALRNADPLIPGALRGRVADNWRPLLAIADHAGGEWPEHARRAALRLSRPADDADQAPSVQLLSDIRELFLDRAMDRLSSYDIVQALKGKEDRPWPEWRNGKPITAPQAARVLRPFGIRPKTIRVGDKTPHGYLRNQFEDAWARYLPRLEPQQAQQASGCTENCASAVRNTQGPVADADTAESPLESSIVADVADQGAGSQRLTHVPAWVLQGLPGPWASGDPSSAPDVEGDGGEDGDA